jgi:hypothetical protein
MRKAIRWTLIFAFALLINYVGAYCILVDRQPGIGGFAFGAVPRYHLGPVDVTGLAGVFRPMHEIDRSLRPEYWVGGFRGGDDRDFLPDGR